MLRACATRVTARTLGIRATSSLPSGGESFKDGHVLVTEQEQGNIVQASPMCSTSFCAASVEYHHD
jgi:hypothetical protein